MILEPLEPKVLIQDIAASEFLQRTIMLSFNLEDDVNFEKLKLCIIPVLIEGTNGRQSFSFLIDTGSQVTVLNNYVAKIIGVDIQEDSCIGQGFGGKSQYKQGTVNNIEIMQGMKLDGQEIQRKISFGLSKVAVAELPKKFSDYSILGILGAETIQEICLKIDYPKKYLEFSKVLPINQIGEANE